ncbi:unnamed protein product [Merluccius merluccius]
MFAHGEFVFLFFPRALCCSWFALSSSAGIGCGQVRGMAAEMVIFNELCVMKEDAGPCKAIKERFYFDIDTGRCMMFEYGGCGGNANNFQSLQACELTCVVPADKSPCHLDQDPGPCRGLVTRYVFDRVSQECRQFYYGGCYGNANNFRSESECQSKCQNPVFPLVTPAVFKAPSYCALPTEEGPCQARELRFAYDPLTQTCSKFRYGGCGGNQNNFRRRKMCMRICMNVRHHSPKMIRIRKKNSNHVLHTA